MKDLSSKRVFVTGCNGFLGQALCRALSEEGYVVYGLKRPDEEKKAEVAMLSADLCDYEKIAGFLEVIDPAFIIHLAARTEVEKSFYDPVAFSEVNYCGTVGLIEGAKALKNLKLFIFASTMETYGAVYTKEFVLTSPDDLMPFDEYTKQYPNAPYAVAKVACEKYLEYAGRAYGFPWTALRQTNTYGRHDNDFFVVEQIITQMLDSPEEINLGYKEPWRNFLYVDDLIELYLTILAKPDKARGEFFCCGPSNALRIKDLAKLIALKLNWKGDINWNQKPERAGEIYYLNSRADKAKEILEWQPTIDLDKGLEKTIKIWKENKKCFGLPVS